MAVPEGELPIPILHDLEEQLSHIEPDKLKNYALYETKAGSYQIVEMNWLNRLIRFIRPAKYDTFSFVNKLCDAMEKSIQNEALPVNYEKLTFAFTRMQGIPNSKLLDIGQTLSERAANPEFETLTTSLNAVARDIQKERKESVVQWLDESVKKITLPDSCRLLRGHPALQQARDLLVQNTHAALQEGIYSLSDFNAILQCFAELDSKLGTKSDYRITDIHEMRRPLQKLEEKLFSKDLKKLCKALSKGDSPPQDHVARVRSLLARAERIELKDPTRLERPLSIISNAFKGMRHDEIDYQAEEKFVESINSFAHQFKIRPAFATADQEALKQLTKLDAFAKSIMQPEYGVDVSNIATRFFKDCQALKIDMNSLQVASQKDTSLQKNIEQLHDSIADAIRFRLFVFKHNGLTPQDCCQVLEALEVLQTRLGLAIPSEHAATVCEWRNQLLAYTKTRFETLQKQVLKDPLSFAQAYSKARQEYKEGLTRAEFDAICDASSEKVETLKTTLLRYLAPENEYSSQVAVQTKDLVQTYDASHFKSKIGEVIPGEFGEKLQSWVDLIPNYQSADHTFAREDLKMTMIGTEDAESAIKNLLQAKGIRVAEIDPKLKVALLCEVLYERAKLANPTATEVELKAFVAELLAISPRDFNPIFWPKKIHEALGTYEKDPMDAKYRLPDAAYEDQPGIHYKFEFGMKDGKMQATVELSHVFELKEGLQETGKKVLFTSKLAKELGTKDAVWQGTLSAKPKE